MIDEIEEFPSCIGAGAIIGIGTLGGTLVKVELL